MKKYKTLLCVSTLSILTACGGGSSSSDSSDSDSEPKNNTGVFLDSPVINIGYRTETLEGVTNEQGEYIYLSGETVTFFIGDLEFPSVAATGTVTPLELAETDDINDSEVINIIRLLQTLDQDGNPDNGLTITETAKSSATQVDFSLPVSAFESSSAITSLIANAGQDSAVTELVSTTDAVSHFQTFVFSNNDMAGYWDIVGEQPNEPDYDEDYEYYSLGGSFDTPCNGDFVSGAYSITNAGVVRSTYNEAGEPEFTALGQMNDARDRVVFSEGTDDEFTIVKVSDAPNSCSNESVAIEDYTNSDMVGYWDIVGEEPGDDDFDEDFEIYSLDGTFNTPCNDQFVSGEYSITYTGELSFTYNENGEPTYSATGQMNEARDQVVFSEVTDDAFTIVKVSDAPNSCDS